MTLPLLVGIAALFYFVASQAGWLEALAERSRQAPPRRPTLRRPKVKEVDRLQVFEDLLQDLTRDDSDPEADR